MTNPIRRTGPGGTLRIQEPDAFRSSVAGQLRSELAPRLLVIAGPDVGTTVRLTGSITIGRGKDADEVLTDESVSTAHVRIEDRGDAWAVVDLASTNGTFVDEVRITESLLEHDQKFRIGTTIVRFEIPDAADQAYDELVERLISLDDLTGLYQRRRFDRELTLLLAEGGQVGLLVMDLDGIKRLNDSRGHLFGAHVIGEAGRRIGMLLRDVPGAFGARFGGDEYTVAAPGLGADGARALAERLRVEIADIPYVKDGVELRVGVSIGLATAPNDGVELQPLFQRADAAMYQAKAEGKNRVAG